MTNLTGKENSLFRVHAVAPVSLEPVPTLKNNDLACLLLHNWCAPAQPADHPLPAVLVPA